MYQTYDEDPSQGGGGWSDYIDDTAKVICPCDTDPYNTDAACSSPHTYVQTTAPFWFDATTGQSCYDLNLTTNTITRHKIAVTLTGAFGDDRHGETIHYTPGPNTVIALP